MRKIYFGLSLALLLLALTAPPEAAAQRQRAAARSSRGTARQVATSAAGPVEPVRTLSGMMVGNRIQARFSDARRQGFDYTVTGARVVDGKLQLEGTIGRPGAAGTPAQATLVGTLARSSNPWPWAREARRTRPAAQVPGQPPQPQGREARNPETAGRLGGLSQATQSTARTTQTPTPPGGRKPEGEVTEQTQSLYAAAETGSGCEVLYLKMALPAQLAAPAGARSNQPVQLGVVLAPKDNRRGEQINQQLCRIVRALDGGQSDAQAGQALQEPLAQLNRLLGEGR